MGFSLRQAEQEELKQQAKRRHEREIQAACQRVNSQQREHKLAQIEREKELERNIAEFAEKKEEVLPYPNAGEIGPLRDPRSRTNCEEMDLNHRW